MNEDGQANDGQSMTERLTAWRDSGIAKAQEADQRDGAAVGETGNGERSTTDRLIAWRDRSIAEEQEANQRNSADVEETQAEASVYRSIGWTLWAVAAFSIGIAILIVLTGDADTKWRAAIPFTLVGSTCVVISSLLRMKAKALTRASSRRRGRRG